jgi:integrase/recombinase XerC
MAIGVLRQERSLNHHEENAALLRDFLRNLEIGNNSPHTVASYRETVKDFLDFTMGLSAAEITRHEITEWMHFACSRGMSASSVSQRLCAVRSFFAFCERIGAVKSSPARLVQRRKIPRPLPHWLTPEQVQRLLGAATNPRDRAIVALLWDTGCRVSEVVGARLEDLDWSTRTIKVLGKGQKERFVLLGKKAAAALESYLEGRRTGPMFLSEGNWKGQPRQKGSVSRDRYGAWRGYWRETDSTGRRVLRSVRLGDYELRTREQAQAALTQHLAGKPLELSPCRDTPLEARSILRIIRDLGAKAGLGRVHPHMIRHSFATAMLDRGADILSISSLLGHASLSATQIYTHCSLAHLRREMQKAHPAWAEERNEET